MKRVLFSVGATIATIAALMLGTGPAAQADDSSCPDGYACFWTGYNYSGAKRTIPASYGGTGWQYFENYKYSMKNRFGGRAVYYALANGEIHCRDAGQEHQQFNNAYAFFVTGPGGACWQ